MALSSRTVQILAQACCDNQAANELALLAGSEGASPTVTTLATTGAATIGTSLTVGTTITATAGDLTLSAGDLKLASGHVVKVNGTQVLGAQQTAATVLTITFTTGGTPATYTTGGTTQTISDSTSVTNAELLVYCNNLRGRIAAINTILHAHGLTT
jgi:hypothetical protein